MSAQQNPGHRRLRFSLIQVLYCGPSLPSVFWNVWEITLAEERPLLVCSGQEMLTDRQKLFCSWEYQRGKGIPEKSCTPHVVLKKEGEQREPWCWQTLQRQIPKYCLPLYSLSKYSYYIPIVSSEKMTFNVDVVDRWFRI